MIIIVHTAKGSDVMHRDDAFIKHMLRYPGVCKQTLCDNGILKRCSRFRLRTYIRVKVDTLWRTTTGWYGVYPKSFYKVRR